MACYACTLASILRVQHRHFIQHKWSSAGSICSVYSWLNHLDTGYTILLKTKCRLTACEAWTANVATPWAQTRGALDFANIRAIEARQAPSTKTTCKLGHCGRTPTRYIGKLYMRLSCQLTCSDVGTTPKQPSRPRIFRLTHAVWVTYGGV